VLETAVRRSEVETEGTIFDKSSLLIWLLWEEDYKREEKDLRMWSNKQILVR